MIGKRLFEAVSDVLKGGRKISTLSLEATGVPMTIFGRVSDKELTNLAHMSKYLHSEFPAASQVKVYGSKRAWEKSLPKAATFPEGEYDRIARASGRAGMSSGIIHLNMPSIRATKLSGPSVNTIASAKGGLVGDRLESSILAHEWGHTVHGKLNTMAKLPGGAEVLPSSAQIAYLRGFNISPDTQPEMFDWLYSRTGKDMFAHWPEAISERIGSKYAATNLREMFAETFGLGILADHPTMSLRAVDAPGTIGAKRFVGEIKSALSEPLPESIWSAADPVAAHAGAPVYRTSPKDLTNSINKIRHSSARKGLPVRSSATGKFR